MSDWCPVCDTKLEEGQCPECGFGAIPASLVPEGTPPPGNPLGSAASGNPAFPESPLLDEPPAAPAVRPEGPEAPKERSFTNSGQKYVVSGYDPAARDTGGAPSDQSRIVALCEQIGFGNVLHETAIAWAKRDPALVRNHILGLLREHDETYR